MSRSVVAECLRLRRDASEYGRACRVIDHFFGGWSDLNDLAAELREVVLDRDQRCVFFSTAALSGVARGRLEDEPIYAWAVSVTGWRDSHPDAPMVHFHGRNARFT